MKKIAFLIFIITSIINSQAQNNREITGQLINSSTKEPIPFVTVILKSKADFKTSIADDNGEFLIKNLKSKSYILKIDAIGYKPFQKNISFDKNSFINLKKLKLQENIEALDAVVIRAETTSIQQKIDRVVINVGKDLTSVGTDAASVLDNVQSVSVDQQTGEISLRGNSNVRVLIDGKPTNIPTEQLIKQLPANAIKNIELITNPSAKYNPEGNSGIINIELVKNSIKGFNGSLNLSGTYGRNFRGRAGTNLNYKVKNANFYANYNFRAGDSDIKGKIERPGESTQNNYGLNQRKNHFIKLGSDIDLDKKTSISLFTVQTFNRLNYSNQTKITNNQGTLSNDNLFELDRRPRAQNYDLSLYKKFDDKKHTLDFGVAYRTRRAPEDSDWSDDLKDISDKEFNYIERINANSKRWIVNLDYAKPLSDVSSIETGLNYRYWNNKKNNTSTQLINNLAGILQERGLTDFVFNRKIYAGYFSYRHQINKLGIQAGLRAEWYDLDANFKTKVDTQDEDVTDAKFSLYPSFFATYKLTKSDQLQFSYTRRVDRPSTKQLNPIRTWGTPLIISQGNQNLEQQFTNSLELKYNKKVTTGNVSFTLFYRRINDFISRSLSKDTQVDNRILLSYANFDQADNAGVELAAYLKFTPWWNFNGSTDLYYQKQQGFVNQKLTTVDNYLFNFRLNNKFLIGKKLSFQMMQMYRGRDQNVQRIRKAMFLMNLGTSYKVLKNKGTITLGVSDVFNSFRARFNITNPIVQSGQFNWESQKITLGFVYNFGNQFKQKNKKRKRRPGEERDAGGDVF